MNSHQQLLLEFGLSPSEVAVYLAMVEGTTKVKDIVQTTGIKRPTVYYAISQLEKQGLIGRIQMGEYNQWKVGSFDCLERILENEQRNLKKLSSQLDAFIASAHENSKKHPAAKVTYYEGKKAIQSIVTNSLYCKNKEILSIAPTNNFFFQVGGQFATKYVSERKLRNIRTRNLWEELLEPKILQNTYKGMSEIRIVPKNMKSKFHTTTFIYDDKVMYIAPVESNYAVIFESVEHSQMMRAIFETIWSVSKPAFK